MKYNDKEIDAMDEYLENVDLPSSINLYINELGKYPLLTLEEEKKYGADLKLKDTINIFTYKKYINKSVKVIDLEKVFVSLHSSLNTDIIINTLLSYFYERLDGVDCIVKNYLIAYKDLKDKLGYAPSDTELKDYFGKLMPNGMFKHFDSTVSLGDKELLKEINTYVKYKIAYDKFVNSNLRLVISIAKHYHNGEVDLLDLINDGNLGLMKAVDKFDVDMDIRFSTYATWWIRQSISRNIIDKGSIIRIPAYLIADYSSYLRELHKLNIYNTKDINIDVLAKKLNIPVERVIEFEKIRNLKNTSYLDRSIRDDEDEEALINFVPSNEKTPEDIFLEEDLREEIEKVLSALDDERTKKILELRFGLNGERPHTLEEVGKIYNVTRERIRQIESKTLRKIRVRTRLNGSAKGLNAFMEK